VDALFWLSLSCALYAYVGYPFVLAVLSPFFRHRRPWSTFDATGEWPPVSIVVPSYNEAAVLGRRLENLLALRYPPDRLEIIVGSDGSTDRTEAVAAAVPDARVRVVSVQRRGGKTPLLNKLVAHSTAEIIVFTDANSAFEPDALERLVAPFREPSIGCVTGELVYLNGRDPGVREGEGLYWRLENAIKEMESRFGGTLVATGAIYALRRTIWEPLPAGISDDSVTPLLALASGYRVVVEPRARAYELAARLSDEYHRKSRMVTRQLGAHRRVGYFLRPFRPVLAFRLASHKLMRWLVPFFLMSAILANLFLLDRPVYQATLGLAVFGALLFLVGHVATTRALPLPAPLRLWMYFCTVNAAAFVGVLDFVRGRHRAVWAVSPSTR
jgi:cellulose synthase/poly-beta-1,6-N-acetylglucosamine synthase-like glycosyltransferase